MFGVFLSTVGPCALEYTKMKTADHFWTDPSADELVQRHRIHSSHCRQDSPTKRPALCVSGGSASLCSSYIHSIWAPFAWKGLWSPLMSKVFEAEVVGTWPMRALGCQPLLALHARVCVPWDHHV